MRRHAGQCYRKKRRRVLYKFKMISEVVNTWNMEKVCYTLVHPVLQCGFALVWEITGSTIIKKKKNRNNVYEES